MADERRALLLGATGLVGREVLTGLLKEPAWTHVTTLGRRPTGRSSGSLEERVVPLDRMEEQAECFAAHDVFCCLGTTLAAAGSRDAFRAVDFTAVALAARLAAAGGAARFHLVSAGGANVRSRIFYSRVKGEAEVAVGGSGVPRVTVLRPSLLLGQREEGARMGGIGQAVGRVLAPFMVGPLRRLKPVPASVVAAAMIRAALDAPRGVTVLENEDILGLGSTRRWRDPDLPDGVIPLPPEPAGTLGR